MAKSDVLGDTPRTDPEPALVESNELKWPTAGELRRSGAVVPVKYGDKDVPSEYMVDQPRTDPKPALVEEYGPTVPGGNVEATPAAAKAADEQGVDLAQVEGSGARGKVVKADVEAAKDD